MEQAQLIENHRDLYQPYPFLVTLLEEAERKEPEEIRMSEVTRHPPIRRLRQVQPIPLYSYD